MKEIVSIQVGDYANFLGSHFWNFQDELLGLADSPDADPAFKKHNFDMDAIYRIGETHQGIQTYTPRLLSIGFQGSLGSVSSRGTLYGERASVKQDVNTWNGHVAREESKPVKKNLFLQSLYEEEQETTAVVNSGNNWENPSNSEIQDKDIVKCLENGVQYWTDFSKVHYHHQSLYELNGMWMDVENFNHYATGRDVFSEGFRGEEINERLRFFIEECDHVQGVQLVVDDHGGFAGVAGEFLENIADDYSNLPVLLFSVRRPGLKVSNTLQKLSRSLHDAVSFSRLSAYCKLIIPIGLPSLSSSKASRYLRIKDENLYHTSAIYASAFHSVSLPLRMEPLGPTKTSNDASGPLDMNEIAHLLAGQGRQNIVATLDAAIPASFSGNLINQCLDKLHPLTPETAEDVEDSQATECMVVHGALKSGLQRASVSEVQEAVQAAYENAVAIPRFSHLSVSQCPLPIPLPFPSIFGSTIGQHGELLPSSSSSESRSPLDVHSIPMAARLRSSRSILPFLENRLTNLRKYGLNQGAAGSELLRSWGFERDDVVDIGETLSKLVSTLDPHSGMLSDSDSD
ncbi:hypothetical protein LIER_21616 [Lithospermum erythrorhizon]|uniref:Protein misato homolog 1 n=1 Tax=Lithospermum erythrorhizon TaxID=34254 RepID=A0AAV3QTS9_LITER